LSDEWLGQSAPWQKGHEVLEQPALEAHLETERPPQFEVAFQVILEIRAGHA
jgi:hypothetical protein